MLPGAHDALVIVDVQNDFVPGTRCPAGPRVVEPLNRAITLVDGRGLAVFTTRDRHPPERCSFTAHGGP